MIKKDFEGYESGIKQKKYFFVIIGFGRMGQSILLELIKIFEYVGKNNLSFTILDIEAKNRLQYFQQQHPLVDHLCSIKTVEVDVKSRDFLEEEIWLNISTIDSVFICLDANNIGVSIAISLISHFKHLHNPIFVQIKEDKGLATVLTSNDIFKVTNKLILPYGILKEICNPNIIANKMFEDIAASLHSDYISQRTLLDESEIINPLLVKWDKLVEERRETMRNKAEHLDYKLFAIGIQISNSEMNDNEKENLTFSENEIEFLAKLEHSRWYADRILNGWKFSSEKNPFIKTNPHLIPWDKLTEEVKQWNRDQIYRIPVILKSNGIQIRRF